MNPDLIRILIVEDEEDHAELIRRAFQSSASHICLEVAGRLKEARRALARSAPDLMILDLLLPDGKGVELLPPDREQLAFPVVVMTAHGNEQAAVEIMKAGALDYIVKSEATLADMPHIAQRALREWRLISERKEAEQALRAAEREKSVILDSLLETVTFHDRQGRIVWANRSAGQTRGLSPDQLTGRCCYEMWNQDGQRCEGCLGAIALETGSPQEAEISSRDGRVWSVRVYPARDEKGEIIGVVETRFEITERKRVAQEKNKLETQMLHAQKMESLGILAGGIAHDFNNLLMGVLGNASLCLTILPFDSSVREYVERIETAGARAAELTQQLLAYSGKASFAVTRVNLSEIVREMAHLLQISISKKVILRYNFAADLPAIQADPTQIRQVVMNLITNASEAIGDKTGLISLTTGSMRCDRPYLRETYLDERLPEGLYVYLEAADTGCGMDAQTLTRIFDPFFTTKFAGRGLGLAAVLGIVRSHKGALKVQSQAGGGTTFRVLFPALPRRARTEKEEEKSRTPGWRADGTVLIVDDEPAVREVAKSMLERVGFSVLTARDGAEGLEAFRQHAGELCAVLLDMTMPGLNGREALRAIRRLSSEAKIILSSGLTREQALEDIDENGFAGFIQKPYRPAELVDLFRETLKV